MIPRPPRSTRTDTLFPTRRFSDLCAPVRVSPVKEMRLTPGCAVRKAPVESTPNPLTRLKAPGGSPASSNTSDMIERSEEHTSELQSLMRSSYAVFCLKTKKTIQDETNKKTTLKA